MRYQDKRKKEHFYSEAKKINVRARSYFKLEDLDKKFNLFKEGQRILDLGCAPGAWIEYIDSVLKNKQIVGVDILQLKNLHDFSKDVKIIEDTFENLEEYENEPFDIMLSDMAPEFSGNSTFDRGRVHKMNYQTLEMSKKFLKKDGNLVFKTFEGEDLKHVQNKAKELFGTIKFFKPKTSQKSSAEVFCVCFRKK